MNFLFLESIFSTKKIKLEIINGIEHIKISTMLKASNDFGFKIKNVIRKKGIIKRLYFKMIFKILLFKIFINNKEIKIN